MSVPGQTRNIAAVSSHVRFHPREQTTPGIRSEVRVVPIPYVSACSKSSTHNLRARKESSVGAIAINHSGFYLMAFLPMSVRLLSDL